MIIGSAAVKRCGMLSSHAAVFAAVAARNDTVISSRELNPLSEGLLREGHASKGFHIKAKSCDWGPMAGFVCADPRFSKAANLAKQGRAVADAQRAGAGLVHLQISSQRLVELDALGLIEQQKRGIAATRILIHASSSLHGAVDFVAVRVGNYEPIWKLYSLKVHHSDESGNPYTPGEDYPLLFFIPREEPCAIENGYQLRGILQRCEAAGYAVDRNLGFRL